MEELSPLEQIGAYLQCSGNPKEAALVEQLVQEGVKVISMADKILRKVSEEERLQYMRESREMAEMEMRWRERHARESGRAEGRAEGHAEGRAEECRNMAARMKAEGVAVDIIIKCSGLTEKEINEL